MLAWRAVELLGTGVRGRTRIAMLQGPLSGRFRSSGKEWDEAGQEGVTTVVGTSAALVSTFWEAASVCGRILRRCPVGAGYCGRFFRR